MLFSKIDYATVMKGYSFCGYSNKEKGGVVWSGTKRIKNEKVFKCGDNCFPWDGIFSWLFFRE
ncbi:hypothetical protein GCM10011573_20130 [Enterococcus wangshanyuanii]|uniref:Uncharacterized protein n=1 Tax=Enterococcus wangshanyuanii TaxID=2005703 RepID=A0ABQ1PAR2_9ENTE|nr:hypothetical protein GCM10011573_20130 [Enterococcus wangshanyuanii]